MNLDLCARRKHRVSSDAFIGDVVENTCFELVPLKNLEGQLPNLPAGSLVSVTCSPTKGIDFTLDLAAKLRTEGLVPVPHIAARLVRDKTHLRDISDRVRGDGHTELFLVGGDSETPIGSYHGVTPLLRDLLGLNHGLTRIGVTGYPDGHTSISSEVLHRELHAKAALLREARVGGWVSTQMCFDGPRIAKWLRAERAAGLDLPVRLGIPGPIDRAKLLTMGLRVGVGQSVRYLQKNRTGLFKLLVGTDYDPSDLLGELSSELLQLNVEGLHLFTFNQLDRCVSWRDDAVRVATSASRESA